MKNVNYDEFAPKMEKALTTHEIAIRTSRAENEDIDSVIECAKKAIIDLVVTQSTSKNRNVFNKAFDVSLEHCKRFSPSDKINIQMFLDMMLQFEWFYNSLRTSDKVVIDEDLEEENMENDDFTDALRNYQEVINIKSSNDAVFRIWHEERIKEAKDELIDILEGESVYGSHTDCRTVIELALPIVFKFVRDYVPLKDNGDLDGKVFLKMIGDYLEFYSRTHRM